MPRRSTSRLGASSDDGQLAAARGLGSRVATVRVRLDRRSGDRRGSDRPVALPERHAPFGVRRGHGARPRRSGPSRARADPVPGERGRRRGPRPARWRRRSSPRTRARARQLVGLALDGARGARRISCADARDLSGALRLALHRLPQLTARASSAWDSPVNLAAQLFERLARRDLGFGVRLPPPRRLAAGRRINLHARPRARDASPAPVRAIARGRAIPRCVDARARAISSRDRARGARLSSAPGSRPGCRRGTGSVGSSIRDRTRAEPLATPPDLGGRALQAPEVAS